MDAADGPPVRADSTAGHLDPLSPEHLRRLLWLSQQFNATIHLSELLPRILELVVETLDAEASSIWMVHGDSLRCELWHGPHAGQLTGVEVPLGLGFAGDAVVNHQPVRVADAHADPRFLHQLDTATGFRTRSVVAVPLVTRDETVGAIEVLNRRTGGVFEEEDLAFLVALADDAAAAIRNARLFEAERQARDLQALLDFSHEITSTFDQDRILVSIVNLAGEAIPFRRCVLASWAGSDLTVRAISGEESVDRKSPSIREVERFMAWATEGRHELSLPDAEDPESDLARRVRETFPRYLADCGARSLLVEDIHDANGELGVLLFEFASPHAVSEWGQKAARLLANEAALALRNAQLYADVPLISWLEPLARRRRQLAGLPRGTWVRYGAAALVVIALLSLVRLPLRIRAESAVVQAAVRQPARAGVAGIVEAVLAREGERVAIGAPIARLRDEAGLLRLRESDAALELAQREALTADARGDATSAVLARLRAAEASQELTVLRQEQARAAVRSPVAGVVLTARPEERLGDHVSAGEPLLWIGDPDWVELELRVRQHDIGAIRLNDRVRSRVAAHPSITFEGRVASIAPRADTIGGMATFAVRAQLDNRRRILRPGMEARAKVLAEPVPVGALLLRRPWRWMRLNSWWILP